MQIQVNEKGYITGFARVGGFPDGVAVSQDFLEGLEREKMGCYQYQDGKSVLDQQAVEQMEQASVRAELIQARENECFPIVNRGKLWYDRLSQQEYEQLETWYQAWLDAPQTLKKPLPPEFIKAEGAVQADE